MIVWVLAALVTSIFDGYSLMHDFLFEICWLYGQLQLTYFIYCAHGYRDKDYLLLQGGSKVAAGVRLALLGIF